MTKLQMLNNMGYSKAKTVYASIGLVIPKTDKDPEKKKSKETYRQKKNRQYEEAMSKTNVDIYQQDPNKKYLFEIETKDRITRMKPKKAVIKAQEGLVIPNTGSVSNVRWEVVKDLKGMPSHEKGGVDLTVGPKGLTFTHPSGRQVTAAQGLYIQGTGWDEIKATINPKNWGVKDYSAMPNFDSAYTTARKKGLTSFMYKNKRYNTDYAGTKEQQLKEAGILNEQKVNRSEVQDRLAKNIIPFAYDDRAKRVWNAVVKNQEDPRRTKMNEQTHNPNALDYRSRLDAYNMYMGIPQQFNTFDLSKNKPSKSKNPDATYYKFNDKNFYKNLAEFFPKKGIHTDNAMKVMGDYTIDYGKDERGNYISYYDEWDLDPVNYGKSFEIYDRIYYRESIAGKDIAGRPVAKRSLMNFSDAELLALDPNNKSADTYLLQEELSNLGYKLPKSTLTEGKYTDSGYYTKFDGVYGPETKQALIDWQTKNKK